jgi:dTDP-4-dehydrorhamnose reductase
MPGESTPLELWGGVECTIVRLGDDYRDQGEETGHRARTEDIALICGLGVKAVRYPILWETVAPERPDRLDFAWTDQRLAMFRERGVEVIGGLLHHGSGPRYTDLLDPDFPAKLGDYAGRVAARYPWIKRWTPVNEPLTTARFSALYGHWYPHESDYRSFLRALVNQCRGTVAAMRAIRAVIPDAELVQTEDLGKTFSTAPLRSQAAHENERRWLSLDLLCGRVNERHPMWRFLVDAGVDDEALAELRGGAGRPDLLGINHYLTSERFLDHRLHLYPGQAPGGNGRDTYVDAEAVRVKRLEADTGIGPRLREAWARYGIPIAVTEVHHGCYRDEQLRWFAEVWRTAEALREEGVDLRAVTLWSAFGNVDWRSLLTDRSGIYDPGAFDIRGGAPRATAIAKAARAFARGEDHDHPALDSPGWWRRPPRLYAWNGRCQPMDWGGRKLLITGATGTLGNAFARLCEERALPFCLTGRDELDICDPAAIAAAIERHRPWAVINTAGFVRVPDAARERDSCFAWNADGPANLAQACSAAGIKLVTFSSDLVFDGSAGPYREEDAVSPGEPYGQSKAEAERRVRAAMPEALVVRTSAFFGPWDRYNFAWDVASALAAGETVRADRRAIVSPTYVPDLAHVVLDLLVDGESGLWHLANKGAASWYDFARMVAQACGFDPDLVVAEDGPSDRSNALESRHGPLLRPLAGAIADFARDVGPSLQREARIAAE